MVESSFIELQYLFSVCKIETASAKAEANLPSTIFQSAHFSLTSLLSGDVHSGRILSLTLLIGQSLFFHGEILSYVLLIGLYMHYDVRG